MSRTLDRDRLRTLKFLVSAGIDTEKKLLELKPEEIADLEGITTNDINNAYDFRKAAKRREFYAYMTGAIDIRQKKSKKGDGDTDGSGNRSSPAGDDTAQLAAGPEHGSADGSTEAGSPAAGDTGGPAAVYQDDAGEYGSQY